MFFIRSCSLDIKFFIRTSKISKFVIIYAINKYTIKLLSFKITIMFASLFGARTLVRQRGLGALQVVSHFRGGGDPLKIKPPIADFLYPPRGFKGVTPPKNLASFYFLTTKGTDAESGFENGTTYLSKVQKWYHLRKVRKFFNK